MTWKTYFMWGGAMLAIILLMGLFVVIDQRLQLAQEQNRIELKRKQIELDVEQMKLEAEQVSRCGGGQLPFGYCSSRGLKHPGNP